jgi:hypothetical protein
MGGKNSVFNKPLGSTGDKIKKAVHKIPVVGEVAKFTDKAIEGVRDVADKVDKEIGVQKVGSVYNANKNGIDGAVGLVARGAAAYYTLGASELVGVGDYTTKQFGKKNDFAQYGKAVGTVAGIAGAGAVANGTHALNSAGYISAGSNSATVANVVSKISGSGGIQGGGRMPASTGVTNNITNQGDSMDDDFWGNLGNIGLDYLNNNVLNNGGGKDKNIPVAQPSYQNFPTQQPVMQVQQAAMDQKTMLMIGGGLVLVLLLVKR